MSHESLASNPTQISLGSSRIESPKQNTLPRSPNLRHPPHRQSPFPLAPLLSMAENLPIFVIHEISARLPCEMDRLHMALACRWWRQALALEEAPPLLRRLPWLVFPFEAGPSFCCIASHVMVASTAPRTTCVPRSTSAALATSACTTAVGSCSPPAGPYRQIWRRCAKL